MNVIQLKAQNLDFLLDNFNQDPAVIGQTIDLDFEAAGIGAPAAWVTAEFNFNVQPLLTNVDNNSYIYPLQSSIITFWADGGNDGSTPDWTTSQPVIPVDLPCYLPPGEYSVSLIFLDNLGTDNGGNQCSSLYTCYNSYDECCMAYSDQGLIDAYTCQIGSISDPSNLHSVFEWDWIAGSLPHQIDVGTIVASNTIDVKLALQGAYDTGTGFQNTALKERGLLPGMTPIGSAAVATPDGQPYNREPWNYTGQEGIGFTDSFYKDTDVDWVLVSLRTGTTKDTEIFVMAGLLQTNGEIRFFNCVNLAIITSPVYIVVEHRNHLPVMSHIPVSLTGNTLSYDFTAQDSYKTPSKFGQIQLNNGTWAALTGNGTQGTAATTDRDDIKGNDKDPWVGLNGVHDQYFAADYNLDADITGWDKTIWSYNNGKSCIVNQ